MFLLKKSPSEANGGVNDKYEKAQYKKLTPFPTNNCAISAVADLEAIVADSFIRNVCYRSIMHY